ncbi:hypothetical protein CQA38_09035 [Campylobacter sp. MIT 12-5580]|uniref:hypothetical protein n=1 Tax=Campylobacter sp. MIT 12-5580 TaxID=2040651 RepID=UPI0010F9C589|nr:hypothetical protein [Campylobacter sp. MIT 12-5580]TKX28097.1 hypothetical protein CQA38_09035 [Campylobacter sp. MIT 12-5580]
MINSIYSSSYANFEGVSKNVYKSKNLSSLQKANELFKTAKSSNLNLVKDKSEAVSKLLGYGVDSEGFFTSDFNENTGIPKSFKIHSKEFELFEAREVNLILTADYTSIDWTESFTKAYKAFEELMGNLTQKYTHEQLNNLDFKGAIHNEFFDNAIDFQKRQELYNLPDYDISFGDMKAILRYKDEDGFFDKSALFHAYFKSNYNDFIVGETNIRGKLAGLDKNISEEKIRDLRNFLKENSDFDTNDSKLLAQYQKKELELMNSNLSIEEFKKQWLELNEEMKAKVQNLKPAQTQTDTNSNKQSKETQDIKKTFKPIQAKSSNQTYKDQSLSVLQKLLEDKFDDLNLLKILFENLQEDKKLDIRA